MNAATIALGATLIQSSLDVAARIASMIRDAQAEGRDLTPQELIEVHRDRKAAEAAFDLAVKTRGLDPGAPS